MDRWLLALAVVVLVGGAWYASRRLRQFSRAPARVNPMDFGLGGQDGVAAVLFTSPHCLGCRQWTQALRDTSTPHRVVDVLERPDLARRYRVRHTPLMLAVRADSGEVAAAYDREPTAGDVNHVAALVAG